MIGTILIGSYRGSPWLQACLNSIPADFSVIVCRNGNYECGALMWAQQNLSADEFLFLQDSTVIKNPQWLYDLFTVHRFKSVSVNCDPAWGGSFLAKYRKALFRQLSIPETPDKQSAVIAEVYVMDAYRKLCTEHRDEAPVLFPELTLANAADAVMHGRNVKVYENEHIIKYKTCFGTWLIDECNARDRQANP